MVRGMGGMRREREVRIRCALGHREAHGQTHYGEMRQSDRLLRQLTPIDSRALCAVARSSPVCVVLSLAPFPRYTAAMGSQRE